MTLTRKPRKRAKKKSRLALAKDNPRSKYWRDRADRLWSQYIRRDGKCAICGRRDLRLEANHLIHRNAVFFRHNRENGICLCTHHHTFSVELSAHGAPWAFEEWMKLHRLEQYAWWAKNRYQIITGQRINYQQVCDVLQTLLETS